MQNILIAGGAGFIGSNFVRCILNKYPDYRVVVYDKLTYAGNLDNLRDVAEDPRYTFVQGDICDAEKVDEVMGEHEIDALVNFAAGGKGGGICRRQADQSPLPASSPLRPSGGECRLRERTHRLPDHRVRRRRGWRPGAGRPAVHHHREPDG